MIQINRGRRRPNRFRRFRPHPLRRARADRPAFASAGAPRTRNPRGSGSVGEDRLARPCHVRRCRIVTHELERKVGFDRGAHVEVAADVQRPAAVACLSGAQVDRDLALERLIDLAEENAREGSILRESWHRPRARRHSGRLPSAGPQVRPARALATTLARRSCPAAMRLKSGPAGRGCYAPEASPSSSSS